MKTSCTTTPLDVFDLKNISNPVFLMCGFRGLREDEQFWVTGIPGDPLNAAHWQWAGYGAPPGIPSIIHPGNNNYVAVSSFKAGDDGVVRRRKANFSRMHMVMVDDVGTKVEFSRLALAPSARVETSPGNFQDWYFLNPPEPDAERADRLIKGMIESGLTADASDPGMRGVTRYGRLPVGVNGKAKYVSQLGHAFAQVVHTWQPQVRYSLDEIADAYRVDMSQLPRKARSQRAIHRRRSLAMKASHETLRLIERVGIYSEPIDGMEGGHRILCPWVHEHTDDDPTGTAYFEPNEHNNWRGGFKCHHGHCQGRNIADLEHFLARLQLLGKE